MLKVTFVVYEKAGLDRAEALRYWRDTHGPIDAKIPGLQRYVQQHAVAAPDGDPPFLGVATLTFADEEAFGAAATSPEFAAAVADLGNFADAERLPAAFVEEVVIVG